MMTDPTALPTWVDAAALVYLKWGLGLIVIVIVLALCVSALHETRRGVKRRDD